MHTNLHILIIILVMIIILLLIIIINVLLNLIVTIIIIITSKEIRPVSSRTGSLLRMMPEAIVLCVYLNDLIIYLNMYMYIRLSAIS